MSPPDDPEQMALDLEDAAIDADTDVAGLGDAAARRNDLAIVLAILDRHRDARVIAEAAR